MGVDTVAMETHLGESPPVASQSSLTGGGMGVDTVAMDTSPMMRSASLHAWYIRSISSLFLASSGDSSIMADCRGGRDERDEGE